MRCAWPLLWPWRRATRLLRQRYSSGEKGLDEANQLTGAVVYRIIHTGDISGTAAPARRGYSTINWPVIFLWPNPQKSEH
jgi:hypothetical protein